MAHLNPMLMTRDKREALLEWVQGEGLDASEIAPYRFRVHNGRISGHKYLRDTETGNILIRGQAPVRVPFNVAQKHPLPECLAEEE